MDAKIGVFVNSIEGYQGSIVREIKTSAKRESIEVEAFDAGHNAAKQAQELVRFANQNPGKKLCALFIPEADAISVSDVDNDPLFHLAHRILRKGVGWIVLNHGREDLIARLRIEFPELPVALVAINNVEFGRVQGRQLRMLLPRGGTALCIRGNPFDTACRDRTAGMAEELQGSGITINEIEARWDADIAEPTVYKWIMSPMRRQMTLDAIVAQNDAMGFAACQAVKRASDELGRPDLRRVPVIGGDGLPDIGLPWVEEKVLTATVCVTLPGKPAVELLMGFWRDGKPIPSPTRLPVESYPELFSLRPITA
jgi:ABC-type sugar transport system substrate-binding protein